LLIEYCLLLFIYVDRELYYKLQLTIYTKMTAQQQHPSFLRNSDFTVILLACLFVN